VKGKVIEWNKKGWVDPPLDTAWQEADRNTNLTPLPGPVDKVFPEDSVCVNESAL
jgi:hypothetical protein